MKTYIGTKILRAKPMYLGEYNLLRGWDMPKDENPEDQGYLVEYLDGGKPNTEFFDNYISWSPKAVFESAYRETVGMNFGLAIEAMKKGLKVARAGWNGKNMFVYFVEGTVVPVENLRGNCAKAVEASINTAPMQNICGHIDMLAADGSIVVGWLASQTDILSDDWEVIT